MTIGKTTSLIVLFIALLTLAACNPPEPAPEPEPMAEPASEPMAMAETMWEKDGLKVYALEDSPTYPGATLTLSSIEDDAMLASGTVPFAFGVLGYELGVQTADAETKGLANSADGQHIHLILNNGPYSAHYTPEFDKELDNGHYVMLAFLSRSYHESLKNPEAAVVKQLTVGDAMAEPVDLQAPHLFYSRPKGSYKGADTEKLMLDFYLWNTDISPNGNKVRATINGSVFLFSKWVPYVIEGLPMGEVTIRLELVDAYDNPIPGPFNDVTRMVTLEP